MFRHWHAYRYNHHWHWHPMHFRRGPSRLVWFFIGAGSATLLIKHKEASLHSDNKRYWGHCFRAPIQVPPSLPNSPLQNNTDSSKYPHPQPWGLGDEQWEADKEKLIAIARQAQDAMADLSESTLDSIITSIEAIKAKLAENRAQREKQQENEQRKQDPSRWV